MEKPSTVDRARSTVPPTAAPPQLLYLDTLRASDFGQFYKRQSFDLLDVQAGQHVLDVGWLEYGHALGKVRRSSSKHERLPLCVEQVSN